jgi:hypothetical protein
MTDPVFTSSDSHLGYALEGIVPAWCITIEINDRRIPVAFSKEQAIEIARRINDYYWSEISDTRDAG